MNKTQITAEPGVSQIIITREFEAPRDLVFRAFTDGNTITGAWEGSADGQEWKHDFGLSYLRVG